MRGGRTTELPRAESPEDLFQMTLSQGQLPHTTSITVRRSVLAQVGMFPTGLRYCLEKPLWLKLYSSGHVVLGGIEAMGRYYLHEPSTCAKHGHSARFRFEDILALTDVYRWLRRTNGPPWFASLVRDRLTGKFYHYCS